MGLWHRSCTSLVSRARVRTTCEVRKGMQIKGKTVVDFGCGTGGDAIEMAQLVWLANPLTRDVTTACVRCELAPEPAYEVTRARTA